MTHSLHNAAPREALTDTIMAAKIRHNLTFEALAEGTGLSLAFVTAALLGQHALPEPAARTVAAKLGLDEEAVQLLQTIPLRGSIPGGVPTDPTIYRFYEMLQVYGSTLKALVHEQFGDGIISAINFKLDIKKVADPDGGERAVITLDGKYLRPSLSDWPCAGGPCRRQIDSQPAIGYINCAETPPWRFSLPEACMLEIVTTR